MPPFPPEYVHYMHWDLHLKPAEYWDMYVEEWQMATAVQAAYRDGQEAAQEDQRKAKERERKSEEMRERLRAQYG